jgi:hypothetical protein
MSMSHTPQARSSASTSGSTGSSKHESVLVEVLGIVTTALDGLPARVTRDLGLRAVIEAEINATLNRASDPAEARARELKATGPWQVCRTRAS